MSCLSLQHHLSSRTQLSVGGRQKHTKHDVPLELHRRKRHNKPLISPAQLHKMFGRKTVEQNEHRLPSKVAGSRTPANNGGLGEFVYFAISTRNFFWVVENILAGSRSFAGSQNFWHICFLRPGLSRESGSLLGLF